MRANRFNQRVSLGEFEELLHSMNNTLAIALLKEDLKEAWNRLRLQIQRYGIKELMPDEIARLIKIGDEKVKGGCQIVLKSCLLSSLLQSLFGDD